MGVIKGEVRVANGLPASRLSFGLFKDRFGAEPELVARLETGDDGTFTGPDVELDPRATLIVKIERDEGDVSLRPIGPQEPTALRLVVPAEAAPHAFTAEFERLNAAVAPVLGGATLATAQEGGDRRDLTLIHRETGWDSRLVGTAALAARLGRDAAERPTGIDEQALYGMLRAGLPSDRTLLARVPVEAVEKALTKSAEAGIISLDQEHHDAAVEAFRTFARAEQVAARPAGGVSTLAEMLDASGLSAEDGHGNHRSTRQRFEDALLGSPEDGTLWKRAADAGLDDATIRDLQGQAKLAFLTTNNAPLMAKIGEGLAADGSLGEHLARGGWDQAATWAAAVEELGGVDAVPEAFKADEEPVAAYADELARKVRVSYPTHVVAGLVESGTISLGDGELDRLVAGTLVRSGEQGLSLGATPMAELLQANADVLEAVEPDQKQRVTGALQSLHRTYQLSPSNSSMKALIDLGLTSAYDIVAIPERQFLDRYGHLFPSQPEARLVYRKSQQVSAVLYTFHSMTQQVAAPSPLPIVSGTAEQQGAAVEQLKGALPTMEALFGSMDYGVADETRTVLSPAAYLVDLYRFLDPSDLEWQGYKDEWARRRDGQAYEFGKPYDELVARRPDLLHLELSHENTTTELPVIDIVNEILEYVVAGVAAEDRAPRDSGRLGSPDVMAEPEFVVDEAYKRLREAPYPLVLPLDIWHETVREFLAWMDVSLATLHEAFRHSQEFDGGGYEAVVNRIGMTRATADLITDPQAGARWWTRLGYPGGQSGKQSAVAELTSAKALARRLGVTYQDLAELLETRFVNPGLDELAVLGTAGVSVADALVWRAQDDLEARAPEDPAARAAWSRATSVQRRLDAVTAAYDLPAGREADTWLRGLAAEPLERTVVLLQPDDSTDLDRTVVGLAGTGVALDEDWLGSTVLRLEILLRLRASLGWSTAEVDHALRHFVPRNATGDDVFGEPLRTALVYLARAIELEQELGTGADERRTLLSLWSDITTAGPQPVYADLFGGRPAGQRDASFADPLGDTLSEAAVGDGENALLRSHVPALTAALGLGPEEIRAVVDRDGPAWDDAPLSLSSVSALHHYAWLASQLDWSVPDLLLLERLRGQRVLEPLATAPLTTFDGDVIEGRTLDMVRTARRITAAGVSMAELAYLVAHVTDPDVEEAGAAVDLATLRAVALGIREQQERAARSEAPPPEGWTFVATALATVLGPRGGLVAALVHGDDQLADPADPGRALADAFLDEGFLSDDFVAADGSLVETATVVAYRRLAKVLLLAERFELTAREIRVLGLRDVPVSEVEGAAPLLGQVEDLLTYLSLRPQLRGRSARDSLVEVLLSASETAHPDQTPEQRLEAATARLAEVARRPAERVLDAAKAIPLAAGDLATPTGVDALWRVLAMAARIGVDVEELKGWLPISDTATTVTRRRAIATAVKNAVRAHLGPVRWRQGAKPVSDRLRQRQRDALVTTVLHERGIASVEKLYEQLLVDPGSEPVLRTTRIRQAISSTQLFVQRCLMNLEPRVHPSALDAEQWAWMKRYRVWEANRKIFLFPENWLEPEFRDDKSHLFAELESTLLQSDVSADVVEDAFLVYLRRLDEIARLDVVAFYTEQDALDPGSTRLHVIGRTHGEPHQYYYRRLEHGIWTPWEPMGVDIEGDHVVPIVWRDRLHVFWVTFLQTSDDSDSNPGGPPDQLISKSIKSHVGDGFAVAQPLVQAEKEPKLVDATAAQVRSGTARYGVSRSVDVQLHWTEYLKGKWSTKTSGGFGRVPLHYTSSVFEPSSVFVHASTLWEAGEEAGVQVHLTGGMTRTFLLRGRNSPPEAGTGAVARSVPYNAPRASINRFYGGGKLTVTFDQKLTSVDGGAETPTASTLPLLGRTGSFNVLPSANGISVGNGDIGSLVSPFFFQDALRTLFVEPSLLEITTETWEEWVVPDPPMTFDPRDLEIHEIAPFVPPEIYVPINPEEPNWLDDPDPWRDLYAEIPQDPLMSPEVGLLFDDAVLGARGGVDLTVVSPDISVVNPEALSGLRGVIERDGIAVATGSEELRATAIGTVTDLVTGVVNGEAAGVAAGGVGEAQEVLQPELTVLVDSGALVRAGLAGSLDRITIVGDNGLARTRVDTALRQRLGR